MKHEYMFVFQDNPYPLALYDSPLLLEVGYNERKSNGREQWYVHDLLCGRDDENIRAGPLHTQQNFQALFPDVARGFQTWKKNARPGPHTDIMLPEKAALDICPEASCHFFHFIITHRGPVNGRDHRAERMITHLQTFGMWNYWAGPPPEQHQSPGRIYSAATSPG